MAKKTTKQAKKAQVILFDQESFFDQYRDNPRSNTRPVAVEVHLPTKEELEHLYTEENS